MTERTLTCPECRTPYTIVGHVDVALIRNDPDICGDCALAISRENTQPYDPRTAPIPY